MRPWYLVWLLFLAYLLSFIDRQIITLMVDPIKQDLSLSDFQFSLLHGLGFGLFFAIFGLPIAYLADRYRRTRIIAVGVVVWSIMTWVCGLARSYFQLFVGRIGVGVGEAALAPAAYSLLSDTFDRRRLPKAMAVFSTGSTLGTGLAVVLGGQLLKWLGTIDQSGWPLIGHLADWQLAFLVAGLPGLLLAIPIWRYPEPARRGLLQQAAQTQPPAARGRLRLAAAYLWQARRRYLGLFGAIAATTALSSAFILWFPAALMRSYQLPVATVGLQFGLIFMVFATAGVLAGGWLVARLWPRWGLRTYPRVMAGAIALAGIAYGLTGLAGTPGWALVGVGVAIFFTQSLAGICITAIQLITPNEMRAQASALFLLFVNLLGYGLGAPIVGALTDFVFHSEQALFSALALSAALLTPLALGCLWWSAGTYGRAEVFVAADH